MCCASISYMFYSKNSVSYRCIRELGYVGHNKDADLCMGICKGAYEEHKPVSSILKCKYMCNKRSNIEFSMYQLHPKRRKGRKAMKRIKKLDSLLPHSANQPWVSATYDLINSLSSSSIYLLWQWWEGDNATTHSHTVFGKHMIST